MIYDIDHRVTITPGTYPGLGEAISVAGHSLENNNGDWYASDAAEVQAIIDAYVAPDLLDYAKTERSLAVSLHAKALRDKVVSAISAGEMASWSIKAAEAAKFAATGDGAMCPLLSAEAAARGVTLVELVAKVNDNAVRFMAAESAISGVDGRHRDAIAALDSVDAVTSYDFSAGWPEV